MVSLEMLREAIGQAKSAWRGCDWHTNFGPRAIDLRGLRSRQALLASKATRGEESSRWKDAAQWLAEVERAADQAAQLADSALNAVETREYRSAAGLLAEAISLASAFRVVQEYEYAKALCEKVASEQAICRS